MNKVDITTNALMEQEYEVINFIEDTAMCGDCKKCRNTCPFGYKANSQIYLGV